MGLSKGPRCIWVAIHKVIGAFPLEVECSSSGKLDSRASSKIARDALRTSEHIDGAPHRLLRSTRFERK